MAVGFGTRASTVCYYSSNLEDALLGRQTELSISHSHSALRTVTIIYSSPARRKC